MSNKAYIVIVCTMIYATCLLAAEHDGSGSADQSAQNVSTTVAMPRQVLKQLLDFNKGLYILWSYAFQLKKSTLLKDEYTQTKYKACKGILFRDLPNHHNICKADTCLKHTQLVNYYNELVIQLRIAEHLINTSITREIREDKRTDVENKEATIIELLRGNILPLLHIALNTTSDAVNCSITERIVDRKMITYNHCASIQTANLFLSQTTLELYHIVNDVNKANMTDCIDNSIEVNELISDYNGTEEWCILV